MNARLQSARPPRQMFVVTRSLARNREGLLTLRRQHLRSGTRAQDDARDYRTQPERLSRGLTTGAGATWRRHGL